MKHSPGRNIAVNAAFRRAGERGTRANRRFLTALEQWKRARRALTATTVHSDCELPAIVTALLFCSAAGQAARGIASRFRRIHARTLLSRGAILTLRLSISPSFPGNEQFGCRVFTKPPIISCGGVG